MKRVILTLTAVSTLVFCSCKHEAKPVEVKVDQTVKTDTIKQDSIQDFDSENHDFGNRYKINEKTEKINVGMDDKYIDSIRENVIKDGKIYKAYMINFDIDHKSSFQANDTKKKYYVYYLKPIKNVPGFEYISPVTMEKNYRNKLALLTYINLYDEYDYYFEDDRIINQEDVVPDEEVID